jgi:hypothetical protein
MDIEIETEAEKIYVVMLKEPGKNGNIEYVSKSQPDAVSRCLKYIETTKGWTQEAASPFEWHKKMATLSIEECKALLNPYKS